MPPICFAGLIFMLIAMIPPAKTGWGGAKIISVSKFACR